MNQFAPAYLTAAIQNECARVADAPPSTRNDTLNKAAFNLASLGIPGREIIPSLHAAALGCGLKKNEIYPTINSGMRAGKQNPRSAPTNRSTRPCGKRVAMRPVESSRVGAVELRRNASENSTAGVLPKCDAPEKFKPDGLSALPGELRRHVYRHSGQPARLKIKLKRDGETIFQNWYAVERDGVGGWQAQKPAEYVVVPYVGSLDAFDTELINDALTWPEGEKDVDTLTRLGVPAFTFGGTGDGTPAEAVSYLKGRRVVILADNDDGGRIHAEKKAALAREAGVESVRVVQFAELPAKADVSDFIETGGTLDQLYARIDAAPEWMPMDGSEHPGAIVHPNSKPARSLIVRRASEITPQPIEWLWPNRVAIGKQTMIVGEPGLGKSQLTAFMAAAVTTGGQWPCNEGQAPQGSVIILSAEDDAADTIRPRLDAAGADAERVLIVSAVRSDDGNGRRTFNLQADLDLLEQEITKACDVRLVIIDPISSYMGKTDSHKNSDVRGVLEPVGEMAARLRVAVVSITHKSKGKGNSAINSAIGSVGFTGVVRSAFMVEKDPEDQDRRLFLQIKNNIAKDPGGLAFRIGQHLLADNIIGSAIFWANEHVSCTADEILAANENASERPALTEAEDFLRDILRDGPRPAKEIKSEAKEAGIAWRTVNRAKKTLGVDPKRKAENGDGLGRSGRWYWSLPGVNSSKDAKDAYECRDLGVAALGDFGTLSNRGRG